MIISTTTKQNSVILKWWLVASILWIALMPQCAAAVSPYPTLDAKAGRFFNHEEWASAAAMFDLMLEEKPDVPSTYGRAIVAYGMLDNTAEQTRLTTMALDNHIPFDTIFSNVKEWSFHVGQPQLFENYLLANRTAHPWMQRTINGYLLNYYAFRSNGEHMVEYARIMLEGAPDNIHFLSVLADGMMLSGNYNDGVATYEKILGIDPGNYNTLLTLGNWFAQSGSTSAPRNAAKATEYLTRAYKLQPTPYVEKLLGQLSR